MNGGLTRDHELTLTKQTLKVAIRALSVAPATLHVVEQRLIEETECLPAHDDTATVTLAGVEWVSVAGAIAFTTDDAQHSNEDAMEALTELTTEADDSLQQSIEQTATLTQEAESRLAEEHDD